jgi:hypothetical protein
MDTKTPIKLDGARLARATAAGALCTLAVIASMASPLAHADATSDRATATLLYSRLTGVPPSAATLNAMQPLIASNPQAAATMATSAPEFYNVTLRNMFLPATNRDQSVFVPLNDYVVTAIGMIKDDLPFNTALSADILYTLSGSLPAPSAANNDHYATADTNNVDISKSLVRTTQTAVYGSTIAPAGLITTRASSSAFFINGTNRAMFRFTLVNHLCRDLEQVQDTSSISTPASAVTAAWTRWRGRSRTTTSTPPLIPRTTRPAR